MSHRSKPADPKSPVPDAAGGERDWPLRVRDHRRRQASVAAILDETFGRFAQSDPVLWDRRAYLMLVGIVYERLACDESTIATDELISLAKLLAESRRADTHARDGASAAEKAEGSRGAAGAVDAKRHGLPDEFGEVVRQVYGTKMPGVEGASG